MPAVRVKRFKIPQRGSRGRRHRCYLVALVVICLVSGIPMNVAGRPRVAYAASIESLFGYNRPEWPEEFGKPSDLAKAARWPGYKGVIGPDSTVWCITLSRADSAEKIHRGFVLTRVDKDMTMLDTLEIQPVQGDVVSFDVAVLGDSALVFWAEKRGDRCYLLLKQIMCNTGLPGRFGALSVGEPRTLAVIAGSVQDVAIAISGDWVYLGWIAQEEGRPGAYVAWMDAGVFAEPSQGPGSDLHLEQHAWPAADSEGALADLPKVRISGRDVTALAISLAAAPGGVWAAWIQSGQILNKVMLSPCVHGKLKPAIEVAESGNTDLEGIVPLITDDGLCHLIFTKGAVHRGAVKRPCVVYGILDSDGNWVMEPADITKGEGDAWGASAALADDTIAIAWSDNRSGKFQVHHALVNVADTSSRSPQVALLSYGAATLSSKECFAPEMLMFDDGTRVILYQVYLSEGDMLVQGVSSVNPSRPGWAYYLGLDLEHPVQDGLFKSVVAIALSLLHTLLALPSLAVGVGVTLVADKLEVFSETTAGANLRSLFLFGVVFLMKRPGAWYYAYAPVLPGYLGWLSFWLASLAVICLDIQSIYHKNDVLSTALSGALYVFFDSLFCTALKGVGMA